MTVRSEIKIEELALSFGKPFGRILAESPMLQMLKEDWFGMVDLRSLREKTAAVLEMSEKAFDY